MDKEKFLFRRQFILGCRDLKSFGRWQGIEIDNKFVLRAHPDLETLKVTFGKNTIVLLGYILDPFRPSLNNREIISDVARRMVVAEDIFSHFDSKCGRFALLVKVGDELRVFNDAAGYRQIFYYRDDRNNVWCASQPSIIAEEFGLEIDREIERDLSQLPLIRSDGRWYPGKMTVYKDIYHLTPNHYLDLNTGEVERFWPVEKLEMISVQEAGEYSARILQGVFESACNRYDVALTVTSGYDTRALLAACKNFKEKIHYVTHTHSGLNENGPDIRTPRQLLRRFGLEHHIAYHSNEVDDDFHSIFRRNVTGAKELHNQNSYAFHKHFESIGKEMVVAQGEAGGLGKRFYRLPGFYKVNEKTLATVVGMRGSLAAERAIKEWLQSAKRAVDMGINILDLLYWEMRLGSWSSLAISSYDIVFESLIPFNCRNLMQRLISVDEKDRLTRKSIHLWLIEHMWPELLEFSLNPPANRREQIIGKVKTLKAYNGLRFLKFTYHYLVGSK